MSRISTLDSSYVVGDLSVYPSAIDNGNTLYTVANNATTNLTQSLTYNGLYVLVESTSLFPSQGLIRVGTELIYYGTKTSGSFQNLIRGFAGSRQQPWPMNTVVNNTVDAEPHNAIRDAIINMETNIGVQNNPVSTSLNGILKSQENKFLAPNPIFRAIPKVGKPPFKVRFQNFSVGSIIRYLWDFGDGGTSTETNPIHTYLAEGIYTVQLKLVSTLKGSGIITKNNYITVSNSIVQPFFYVTPEAGTTSTIFTFIDQTDGNIVSRHWVFGDGTIVDVEDPDSHVITYQYTNTGSYSVSLMIVFSDGTQATTSLPDNILVQ